MILAAGLMLTLSTTKGSREQQGRNSGVRGQRPVERWCWRWPGSSAPAAVVVVVVVMMTMMAIRGTVADRSGVRRSTMPSAGERAEQR
jgi:hypothetical protein